MVPDIVGALLSEMPSLPSQAVLLIGVAAEVPVLVRVDDLPLKLRPNSADPAFERAWTAGMPWNVDALAETWLQATQPPDGSDIGQDEERLGDNPDGYEPPNYEIDSDDRAPF